MQIKLLTLFSVFLLGLFSCTEDNRFPEKKSEKFQSALLMTDQKILLQKSGLHDNLPEQTISTELLQLMKFISDYENKNENFSVEKMELLWELENKKFEYRGLEPVLAWIETTGFLLEITGKSKYAEALQNLQKTENLQMSDSALAIAGEKLTPYIFTKNVDHIFVNLFVNSSVEYVHTLGGKVKISQLAEATGTVVLKFNMEEKRYIELHIFIPTWATNATVTEKNVKYVANPGEYCFIARKWGDGDFVEIKL